MIKNMVLSHKGRDTMDKLFIGYVQGVHGLRGDLKVKNKFSRPENVFIPNKKIYLNDEIHTITACKFYKGFYLVTIDNIKDINKVEHYIGYDVLMDRDELNLKDGEYLNEDLICLDIVSSNKNYGKVKGIENNGVYDLLIIDYEHEYMIPLVDAYVKNIDITSKKIECSEIEDLIL